MTEKVQMIMTPVQKIQARRDVVAESYASLMRWAKRVGYVPAATPEAISEFYRLPSPAFSGAVDAGLGAVVAEYKGLSDAAALIGGQNTGARP